ncbi:DUF4843 domain-containing protein [Sphingobacterium corticis]|uniref:DUF4843 domain-containing protein n=2 Tax=Sphingobacterium corticis TaxID=1812823 RepID=A0ABW5NH39_9SPHI
MFYEGPDAISIYREQYAADSVNYSFAFKLGTIEKDTVWVNLRLQGAKRSYDRWLQLSAAAGTTATKGVEYELPSITWPADSVTLKYPVILLRSPELKRSTKTLIVAPMPNEHFTVAALGQEIGNSFSIPAFKIHISDFLAKPAYWDNLSNSYGWGSYSEVKFQFMLTVYGISDFSQLTSSELLNTRLRFRKKLQEYVAENGPLIDENGQNVSF